MNNELISIVVPIYNVEHYLKKCIESILIQTYKNIEIILVDDGSPDNCPKICEDYKSKDLRIKVIHKENGGLSDARNKGIKKAKGTYITFVDSDDTIEPDYVEYLYSIIKKFDADISICDYNAKYSNGTVLNRNKNSEYRINKKEAFEIMLYQSDFTVSSWAKLYRYSLFKNIEFPYGKIFEDAYTTYKLIDLCNNIGVGLKPKYNYIIRDNSILTSEFYKKKLLLVDAYEKMTDYVEKEYPDLRKACIRANIYSRISTLRQMIYSKNRLKKIEKEYVEYIRNNGFISLKDKKISIRDRIAIILIMTNLNIFKICWKIYCKITGRTI